MARLPNLAYVQSFSAVARAGSLAAATKAGASSQATLSRHIAALEANLQEQSEYQPLSVLQVSIYLVS